jgi:AcrR family transcriptional regulator
MNTSGMCRAMEGRRQEILDAALALADDKGLAAVSMRAVAERTGVTPMALYPYVGSKAALLDGMVGRLLVDLIPDDDAGPDWRQRLRVLARSARGLAHRHPWAATLLFARPAVAADAVIAVEQIYAALLDAGVPDEEVVRVERMISTLILGYAASEVGGRFGPGELDPRGRRGQLPEGALPAHATLHTWLDAPVDWDVEFEADIDDLLRLVERIAGEGSAGRRRTRRVKVSPVRDDCRQQWPGTLPGATVAANAIPCNYVWAEFRGVANIHRRC